MVKKMIAEEDRAKPLTDEQITAMLQAQGINVTTAHGGQYREDMKIRPPTSAASGTEEKAMKVTYTGRQVELARLRPRSSRRTSSGSARSWMAGASAKPT